jgi:uncharacterized protein YecT (DUF1311 family)
VRRALLVLSLGILVAGCSSDTRDGKRSARSAAGPPVIHEPFERSMLPCPRHPTTTIELEGCAERELLQSDHAVNSLVDVVWRRLPRVSRARFSRSERRWLAYRQESCVAETGAYRANRAHIFLGGSIAPVALAYCEARRNARHITDLDAMAAALSPA